MLASGFETPTQEPAVNTPPQDNTLSKPDPTGYSDHKQPQLSDDKNIFNTNTTPKPPDDLDPLSGLGNPFYLLTGLPQEVMDVCRTNPEFIGAITAQKRADHIINHALGILGGGEDSRTLTIGTDSSDLTDVINRTIEAIKAADPDGLGIIVSKILVITFPGPVFSMPESWNPDGPAIVVNTIASNDPAQYLTLRVNNKNEIMAGTHIATIPMAAADNSFKGSEWEALWTSHVQTR